MALLKYIWRLFASDSSKFVTIFRLALLSPPTLLALAVRLGAPGPVQELFSWTNVLIGTAAIFLVILFWRAISHGYRLEQSALPKIKLLFAPEQGSIVITPQRMVNSAGNVVELGPAKFVRGIVEGQSATNTKDCRVHLESVLKQNPDGIFEPTDYTEAIALFWSNTHQKESMRIANGTRYYFDILSISERHPKPVIAGNLPLRLESLFDDQGTYRIGLTISTEEDSQNVKIDITWGPDWTNVTGKLIEPAQV